MNHDKLLEMLQSGELVLVGAGKKKNKLTQGHNTASEKKFLKSLGKGTVKQLGTSAQGTLDFTNDLSSAVGKQVIKKGVPLAADLALAAAVGGGPMPVMQRKRETPWIAHVKAYHKANPHLTYGQCMKESKSTYKK